MTKTKIKQGVFALAFSSTVLSFNAIHAATLDLSSGSSAIDGSTAVRLENVMVDGVPYNASIELRLDGTYSVISSERIDDSHIASYQLTFTSTWSSSSHPTDFPGSSAHFSGLVGANHKADVKLWENGQLSSAGIKSMAETGAKSSLLSEVDQLIAEGKADQKISGGGISSGAGSVSVDIEVNRVFPNVSAVSMIAPSPDWFVGVSGLSLLKDGQWVDELIVPVFAYDAGTDSGSTFTSPNSSTQPAQPISRIEGFPISNNGTVTEFGNFRFKRIN